MINEKYFLDRLAAGESIEDIGKEITDAMNAAATKHAEEEKKKAALAEQEATKHELIAEVFLNVDETCDCAHIEKIITAIIAI